MSTQDVTITVQDQSLDPVEGLALELRRTRDDSIVTTGVTDSSGQIVVSALLNGSYYVVGSRSLTSFSRQPVVVANTGTPQAFSLDADVTTITAPTPALTCKVYGFLSPSVHSPTVTIERENGSRSGGGSGYQSLNERVVPQVVFQTPTGGVWDADLERGAVYVISIPALSFQKRIKVPSESMANVEDIPSLLGSVDFVTST